MKFIVLWHLEPPRLTPDVVRSVLRQPEYAEKPKADGKLNAGTI